MRTLLIVTAIIIAIVVAVVVVGYLLPARHVATVAATIPASPEVVWDALTTPAEYPAWRRDVASVEMLASDSGRAAWRESGKDGAISYVVERAEAPHRLVTRITDQSLPFGGSWEYLVTADGAGSRVQITEHGEVYNPVFRFVSRYIMGHTATASAYLKALGRRYGAEVEPVVGGATA
jgi:uncharacterized protein YndB with AHSA1/START domain